MTDEQKNAIDHAQKILRAVKLYDHAALLSASIADTAGAKAVGSEWRAIFNSTRSPDATFEQFCEWMREELAATPAPSVADARPPSGLTERERFIWNLGYSSGKENA